MSQFRVVISEFMDEAALGGFGEDYNIVYDPALVDDRQRLLGLLHDADALIVRNRTRVDENLLDAAPLLKVVGQLGVGLDNIDLEACHRRSIDVKPATGANTLSVVEYVIATALVLVRGAYLDNEDMLAGNWPRDRMIGGEIAGRVMGLYGFGGIARSVAAKMQALGMRVVAHDPFVDEDDPVWEQVEYCSAASVLAKADILSLHVPLTDETRNLIGREALSAMKQGAILINTSRGHIVDEEALTEALKSGKLGGAALDVFASEPLIREKTSVFQDVPNLILTPHIAGVTQEGNVRVSQVTVSNVRESLEKPHG